MAKVREQNEIKLQQLETTIQDKLVQAQTRKEQIEQEQKEKLKTYVSIACFFFFNCCLFKLDSKMYLWQIGFK